MPLYRILREPNAREEGTTPPPDVVTISRVELDALRARAEAAMGEAVGGDPSRGDHSRALNASREAHAGELAARDRKAAELEQAYKVALRDRDLATALVGRNLLPGAAAQLVKLWRDDLVVQEGDGEYRVSARDGRSVGQAVADWLASPEYAHFCPPASRGGIAIKGANRPSAAGVDGPAPKNLGEAVVMRWHESAARHVGETAAPIGLSRRR
jgi:hypothetical protein